jgi:hypothetical protein
MNELKMKMKAKKRIIHAFRHQVHTHTSPLSTAAYVFVLKADKVKMIAMQIVCTGSFSELQNPQWCLPASCHANPELFTPKRYHTEASIRIY